MAAIEIAIVCALWVLVYIGLNATLGQVAALILAAATFVTLVTFFVCRTINRNNRKKE